MRKTCSELCITAEKYASQDEVKQQHLIPKKPIFKKIAQLPEPKTKEIIILEEKFLYGLNGVQIAEKYGYPKRTVQWIIKKHKEILIKHLKKTLKN